MNKKILIGLIVIILLATLFFIFRGNEDSWICENGEWVKHGNPSEEKPSEICETNLLVNDDETIKVSTESISGELKSPIQISGEATGSWYFEANFPIKIYDDNGEILGESYAEAIGDWMTEELVPFEATIEFTKPSTETGLLVFEKSNASGLPEFAESFQIPVQFGAVETQTKTIKIYYYNPELDKDSAGNILCSEKGLVPVEYEIPLTITPIQDAINLLLAQQLLKEETDMGLTNEFPLPGFVFEGASLVEGKLTLTFADPENQTTGGACRAGILWSQIEKTAKQFDGVKEVTFKPDYLFQP